MTDRLITRFSGGGLGLTGQVIQRFTWSWCSHVEFEIPWYPPEKRLLGAMPGTGVAFRPEPLGKDREPRVERYVIKGGEPYERDVLAWAETQLGKPYDWAGILGYALHRDWADERDWFCSEFETCGWMHGRYPVLNTDGVWRISPRDRLLSPLNERIS